MNHDYPRLLADIGGTNARFALQWAPDDIGEISHFACADYPSIDAAIAAYLSQQPAPVHHGAIAIANPITGDWVKMTNHHWQFSIQALKQQLGLTTLVVINDFTAQALALTALPSADFVPIGTGVLDFQKPLAVVGAGTGLGVSGLIPYKNQWLALSGDGGHAAFAPRDELERALLAFAQQQYGHHVSCERILAGSGLSLLYAFLAEYQSLPKMADFSPAAVTHGALVSKDPLCQQVLARYCRILGDTCANVALTLGALGGVCICGGVVPRFVDFLKESEFMQAFEDKGRLSAYMQQIPVFVVQNAGSGITGAALALSQHFS